MKHLPYFFAMLFGLISQSKALVLEDLIKDATLEQTLSGKKVGFYTGSFDPLHRGHEETARLPMTYHLCDYVIMYPAWGGDPYKDRTPISTRLDMLFNVFKAHPHVIVTRLKPADLQRVLTKETRCMNQKGQQLVEPAFPGTSFIGIVGSDVAIDWNKDPKKLAVCLTGIKIPDKYQEHTLGGLMALPAEKFIVVKREGDDLSLLNNKIGDRPIIATLENKDFVGLSSTKVKKALKEGKGIDHMVSEGVRDLIQNENLYQ